MPVDWINKVSMAPVYFYMYEKLFSVLFYKIDAIFALSLACWWYSSSLFALLNTDFFFNPSMLYSFWMVGLYLQSMQDQDLHWDNLDNLRLHHMASGDSYYVLDDCAPIELLLHSSYNWRSLTLFMNSWGILYYLEKFCKLVMGD